MPYDSSRTGSSGAAIDRNGSGANDLVFSLAHHLCTKRIHVLLMATESKQGIPRNPCSVARLLAPEKSVHKKLWPLKLFAEISCRHCKLQTKTVRVRILYMFIYVTIRRFAQTCRTSSTRPRSAYAKLPQMYPVNQMDPANRPFILAICHHSNDKSSTYGRNICKFLASVRCRRRAARSFLLRSVGSFCPAFAGA
jgi:hypothetical protein